MTDFDIEKALMIAKDISIKAGAEILKIYETDFDVEYKSDKSPLTKADTLSNDLIVSKINKEYPDHSVLSEEHEDDRSRLQNDWCWIIDPLDGTKEFLKKNGEFTVNVALTYKKDPVIGVVYLPVNAELYYASKGNGAYFEVNGQKERINVSNNTEKLRLMKSRSHASGSLEKLIEVNKDRISEIKSSGSSIKGCIIAKGDADVYYRFNPTMEWDTAAMQCVVEEAGGIFKEIGDGKMVYNRENTVNDKGFYILNKIESKLNIEG